MNNYIKVTPKGEKTPRIVLATLKAFYQSQGAKVETATAEEVYAAEPALRPKTVARPATPAAASKNTDCAAEIQRLEDRATRLANEKVVLEEKVKEYENTISTLNEKLAASEAALEESEKVIQGLRKAIDENAKPAKGNK